MAQFFAGLVLGILVSWAAGIPKFFWNLTHAATEFTRLAHLAAPLIGTALLLLFIFLGRHAVAGSLDWLGVGAWVVIYLPYALSGILWLVKRLKAKEGKAANTHAKPEPSPKGTRYKPLADKRRIDR